MRAAREEDCRRGFTSVGPHRDDYKIIINGKDARAFASQGQQRTAALSLKLAEIEVMREETNEAPVLLLDDVMSELDVSRRRMLLTRIGGVQTMITCTHLDDLGGAEYEKAISICEGKLNLWIKYYENKTNKHFFHKTTSFVEKSVDNCG